ncbi:hypothetical protein D3C71_2197430 [compost metagenome]
MPWAENFGQQCQQPDFTAANKRYVTQALDDLRSTLRPYKRALQITAIILVVGAGLLMLRRRGTR